MIQRSFTLYILLLVSGYLLTAGTFSHINLEALPNEAMVWKNNDNLYRVWMNETYYFVDAKGDVLLDLSEYKSVGDFNEGLAPVSTFQDKHGFINLEGDLVIDTQWDSALPSSSGFVLVAKNTGKWIQEDRGEGGLKNYPEEVWFLMSNHGEKINLPMKEVMNIQGLVNGTDHKGNKITIDLNRVNFGYYHPLMKAVVKANGHSVYHEIEQEYASISMRTVSEGKLVYILPFQKN